jgi:hypothetical protein
MRQPHRGDPRRSARTHFFNIDEAARSTTTVRLLGIEAVAIVLLYGDAAAAWCAGAR